MALYDTSNIIDNSIFLKAKLEKNMVGSNYYIENLQDKRNQDWDYRYNVVGIEEELEKQKCYTTENPIFSAIDAVITHVKSDKGEDLGTDWAHLSFKNLRHPCNIGARYRFSLDFPNMEEMSEEEKHYDTSVWLCVNKSPIRAGNACTVRRCNTALTLLGSPTNNKDYITEVHQEPCILENELKYMQTYYNLNVPVPQAEWYATMQLNYFTNFIGLNDRFVVGVIDSEARENNSVYKVKAVIKSTLDKTFIRDGLDEMESTPLVIVALDKDMIAPDDDIINRVAESATIYKTIEEEPVYEYYIKVEEPCEQRILLTQTEKYEVNLCYNNKKIEDVDFEFTVMLNGIIQKNWGNYFVFEQVSKNSFTVQNIKACNRGSLVVTASCKTPSGETIKEYFEIELGGFY